MIFQDLRWGRVNEKKGKMKALLGKFQASIFTVFQEN